MKNTLKISIILPVYNRRHLISRAIDSVQRQTFENWELLIIDDGSTDGVKEDILPLTEIDNRIRFLSQRRTGPAETRNRGIRKGSGFYITFIDSDDQYHRDHLQVRYEFMQTHPHVDVIHGGVALIGPEEKQWVVDANDPGRKIHLSECYMAATLFGKRDVFIQSGGFKPLRYSAESEFIPRLEENFQVEVVPFPTYCYHIGLSDSICAIKANETN
ncbi:MAG: glycosyltransferase family A protein [candidate division KSB1 bacterium]|nr:glycosyltransferase family A protein [candidate division KSB1 bacterium]